MQLLNKIALSVRLSGSRFRLPDILFMLLAEFRRKRLRRFVSFSRKLYDEIIEIFLQNPISSF